MRDKLAFLARMLDLRDVLVFGGIAAAGYGLSLLYLPAAWVLCGLALAWLGLR